MFEAFIELAKCAGTIGSLKDAMFSEKIISFDVVDNKGSKFNIVCRPAFLCEDENADT